jgi:hypothetical protein
MIISTGKLEKFEEKPVPQTSHEAHGTENPGSAVGEATV